MAAPIHLSPAERQERARLGAHSMLAKNDPKLSTRNGRAAFTKRFVDEVDPSRVLPEAERARRAEHAKKAYFARIALESMKARRERAEARKRGKS